MRITDIQNRQIEWNDVPFADEDPEKARPYEIMIGDILFARTGATVGKSHLIKTVLEPSVFASYLIRVRSQKDILFPEFAAWYFQSPGYWEQITQGAKGTGQPNFNGSKLAALSLPIPPPPEQRRIVTKLNALTARLARARAELDRITAFVPRIREKVLLAAAEGKFSGRADVVTDRCEKWIESTFYGPRFGKEEYVENGIPTARTTDFNDDGTMSIEAAPRVTCSQEDFEKWGLHEGDLLVTRTGSIGKCAIYNESYGSVLPSAYLIRVRFSSEILPRFAWMMFASPQGQKYLGANSRAVTQPNINAHAIRSLPFPILTLAEQRRTIDAVDVRFARWDRLEAEVARSRKLVDHLESAILAKAFRGELVPQDPADEDASIFLERIRAQRSSVPSKRRQSIRDSGSV